MRSASNSFTAPPSTSTVAASSSYCSSFIFSSIGCAATTDGKRRGPGVYSFARPALALLVPLALTACGELRETAARDVLREADYEHVVLSPEPWLSGPCDWSERYASRFVARKGDEQWTGIVCAAGEGAQDARIIAVRIVPQPDAWDSFGGPRR